VVVLLEGGDDPVPDVRRAAEPVDEDDRWSLTDADVVHAVAVDVREHVAPSVREGIRDRIPCGDGA
jgi:hypothetical protein